MLQTKTNLGFLQNVKYFQRALCSGAAKPNLTFISNSSISLCSGAATKPNLGFFQNVKYFQRALRSGAAEPNLRFISNSSISLCSGAANQN